MSKLEIVFGEPVALMGSQSIYIYADYWESRVTGLMYELTPVYFHQQFNCYEATTIDLEYLERRCQEMHLQYNINIPKQPEEPVEDIKNEVSEVSEYKYKTPPLSHQIVGIEFGMNRPRYLLGDDMGLGKTKQVIDIGCRKKYELGYKHCLIICGINGLKWNWEEEIKKHSDEKCKILGNRKNTKGKWVVKGNKEKLQDITPGLDDDIYFYITNVETLRNNDISNQLQKLCDSNEIQMIAFDEFHVVNSIDAQQSKGLLKLAAESMIAMTGSPIMNSPLDLYMCLHWLGYERHDFNEFKNHFCRMGSFNSIVGFKNMEQIQNLLKIMMLRRLKGEVIDLPPKIHKVEYVEMSSAQNAIYQEVLNDIREQVDLIARSNNPLANLIRLRQATGHTSIISSQVSESAKVKRLKEIMLEITANGHKAIIFSNWTSMTDILQEELKQYNPAVITGDTRDRVEEQNRFMNDPECKIIIGTIQCMGVGLTLTAADYVIFVDEPFTAAMKVQAEDRAHRIGTKNAVTIITLITRFTIDERVHDIVERKGEISEAIIDNLDCEDLTKLLNFLIS